MGKEKRPFCCHKNFVPSGLGLYTCAWGYMHVKLKKKSRLQRDFFKLATNGQNDKGFLLTSTFVPKGLSVPALGLYTCIKALKYIPGPSVRCAFTGPLVLWFFNVSVLSVENKDMLVKGMLVTLKQLVLCYFQFSPADHDLIDVL